MHSQDWTNGEIASALQLSTRSVSRVINDSGGERGKKKADRFEYLSAGGNSGCYDGVNEMLTEEQLHANDPLAELMALETVQERLDGLKSND